MFSEAILPTNSQVSFEAIVVGAQTPAMHLLSFRNQADQHPSPNILQKSGSAQAEPSRLKQSLLIFQSRHHSEVHRRFQKHFQSILGLYV